MLRFILILFLILSCSKKEEDSTETITPKEEGFYLSCVRWFDRDLYFAFQDTFDNTTNNEFDKLEFRKVLDKIQLNTNLGEGYWRYETVTPEILSTDFNSKLPEHEQKSAILFYNDTDFDKLALNKFGGYENLDDPNSIILINPYFKRKFIMVLRSSCFGSSGNCVGEESGQTTPKVEAFVNRQIGKLFGITNRDCTTYPNDIMCVELREEQGSDDELFNHYGRLNERLNSISLNDNYFDDYADKKDCLETSFMDKSVYFSFADSNPNNNNSFHKNIIQDCLSEISCNSLLGCDYFTYKTDERENLTFSFDLENNGDTEFKSFILILDDSTDFSELYEESGGTPDPNSITVINSAKKDEYRIAFRSSCFDSDDKCIGKELGVVIPTERMCSIVARQLGFLVNMETKDCSNDPSDVMCIDPSSNQWNDENKSKWLKGFDNHLEIIGNDPNFYYNFGNEVGDGQL